MPSLLRSWRKVYQAIRRFGVVTQRLWSRSVAWHSSNDVLYYADLFSLVAPVSLVFLPHFLQFFFVLTGFLFHLFPHFFHLFLALLPLLPLLTSLFFNLSPHFFHAFCWPDFLQHLLLLLHGFLDLVCMSLCFLDYFPPSFSDSLESFVGVERWERETTSFLGKE